jgi:shikimate dehydrogenase
MQNAGFAELRLNWRYLALEVDPRDLREAINGAKSMRFIGLNLTVPHKLLALDLVDGLDESARIWGAVNTIRFEGKDASGKWRPLAGFDDNPREVRSWGYNTDAAAITRSLQEDLKFETQNCSALVLGAGGAGRTAALKLAAENVSKLFLVNRTSSKVEAIKAEIAERSPKVKVTVGYPNEPVDLVLNATSLGLKTGDPLPIDERIFELKQAKAVYDMIYRPAETAFLRAARAAGCKTANGLGMLLYQGAKALEIWTGKSAPLETMRRALHENVYGSADTAHK